ncbi:MAG: radical SAM protein [Lachnospiraceae bacterium]|nr:radical SAM protein [Lachnospiraceae bacterium]
MKDNSDISQYYSECTLCPRQCRVNRTLGGKGFCRMGSEIVAAKAYRHMWEEPVLTGKNGSGTVFFSGCNLKCVFCQNSAISSGGEGAIITAGRLSEIFLELQDAGASNINLVTGVCFIPHIRAAITDARKNGLTIPTVYNSGGYESVQALKLLDGCIDIYMPDFKYMSPEKASEYSSAWDYPDVAKPALKEMFSQTGPVSLSDDGIMKKGMIVRHLVLPGAVPESKRILRYLHDTYGNDILVSIMNQYTPMPSVSSHPLLGRKVTDDEYRRVVEFASEIGIENGFTQLGEAAKESFIPNWDLSGIIR